MKVPLWTWRLIISRDDKQALDDLIASTRHTLENVLPDQKILMPGLVGSESGSRESK